MIPVNFSNSDTGLEKAVKIRDSIPISFLNAFKIHCTVNSIYCDNCLILRMIAVNERQKSQYDDKQKTVNRPLTLRVKVLMRNLLP
jgi:hypothetical protein